MEREALWSRVGAAGFLTDDEKGEAVGYARVILAPTHPTCALSHP